MKYFVSYQNGAFAVFEWMGDLADDEQLDDLLEAAYQAAPGSLCHQCAENFEISDDAEVREIREEESHKMVFEEPTWSEELRESATRAGVQRDTLATALREAGFTVDPVTFAVSR